MKKPPSPANEAERLLALRSYAVLDTAAEPEFDALAKLAAHILETPIALVSLVDADRQWFKARYGLDAPETPRDVSFCGHIVATERPLIVNDAHEDNRFVDNPLVTGAPNVRFYAGMPLTTPDGMVMGSLCAIDHVARRPSAKQLEMLELLAKQVVDQLEMRRARLELASEREQAREAAERLTMVFATMAEGVTVQDAHGRITDSNPAAQTISGMSSAQLRGVVNTGEAVRVVRENGTPMPFEEYPSTIARTTGKPVRGVVLGFYKPDDTLTWVRANSVPRFDTDGAFIEVVNTFHDITAHKAATDRAAQQERLATVGTLSAGLGHEINNPLAYILGNIDFAIEEVRAVAGPSPSARMAEVAQTLVEAREGAERIRKLVKGLRALAREDVVLYGVPVAGVIETSISMAAHEIRKKATVVQELQDLPPALADESRLTQVMVNLVMNAAQAFEGGDPSTNRITVSTARTPDNRIRIRVSDNGPGIPQHLLTRIFDAFFTTKPVGVGTGLGLPVSRNLIASLGGELLVESTPGEGATFTVLLPIAPTEGEIAEEEAVTRGKLLLIDDEPAVLNALRRVLSRDHDVTVVSDSREALTKLQADPSYDMILCDMMMPTVTGAQLFKTVDATMPGMSDRFVFMTGGMANSDVQRFMASISNERIEKPFSSPGLLSLASRFVAKRAERR